MVDLDAIHARSAAAMAGWDRRAAKKAAKAGQPRQKRANPEFQAQSAFVTRCRAQRNVYPALNNLFAVPNAKMVPVWVGARYKAEGVEPGVPDMMLAWPASGRHGLYLEFKSDVGSQSPEQKDWERRLRAAGYGYALVRSAEEGWSVVMRYLGR